MYKPVRSGSARRIVDKSKLIPILIRNTLSFMNLNRSRNSFTDGHPSLSEGYDEKLISTYNTPFRITDALDTFTAPGYKTAMIEIAPAFAGIIFAIANTIANASGFLAPQIAGALRQYHVSQ